MNRGLSSLAALLLLLGPLLISGCASTDPAPPELGRLEVLAFRLGQPLGSLDDELLQQVVRTRESQTTMVVYDGSLSMVNPVGRGDRSPRYEPAKAALERYLENTERKDRHGLVVFGHRRPTGQPGTELRAASCEDVELIYAPGEDASPDVAEWVSGLGYETHRGDTPLASAVLMAMEALQDESGDRRIVVVTDGLDECDGRLDEVARLVGEQGIRLHVIAFGVGVDRAGRTDAAQAAEVERILRDAVNAGRGLLDLPGNADEIDRAMLRIELAALGFELRRRNGQLVARGSVGQTIDVAAGRYDLVLGLEEPSTTQVAVNPGRTTQILVGLGEGSAPELRIVSE